jgi:dihydroneopterin aldolase/2-amino-4-hydroxy-6-hydroxymethyldihydropteridine diphosphokinase/dihydropteroate synthase
MSARGSAPPVCTPTPHHIEAPQSSQNADVIRVRNLLLLAHVADGAQWPSSTSAPVRQPVRVSIDVPHDLRCAASRDDISKSINYGTLSKRVLASVDASAEHPSAPPPTFRSLEQLANHIFSVCFGAFPEIQRIALDLVKPRALPYADAVRVRSSRTRDGDGAWTTVPDRLSIERLACNLVVGLNPCEREDRQLVCFDVDISTALEPESAFDFRRLARDIRQVRAAPPSEEDFFFFVFSLTALSGSRVLRVCVSRSACVPGREDHASPR